MIDCSWSQSQSHSYINMHSPYLLLPEANLKDNQMTGEKVIREAAKE